MRFSPSLCRLLVAAVLVSTSACDLITASNPFDPATDESARALATVTGTARFADGRAPRGITVVAVRADTGAELDREEADDETGAYKLVIPSVKAIVTAAAVGFVAPDVRIDPLPGDVLDLNFVLAELAPTGRVSGRVAPTAPITPQGVAVSLVEVDPADDGCLASVAATASDGTGAFEFPAVRPGRYRVFAATAGALTALDDAFDVDIDGVVERAPLPMAAATDAIDLQQGGAAVAAVSGGDVDVVVEPQAGLDELRIGLDPTFDPAQGGTGLVPFAETTAIALPAIDGPATVFVELQGRCGRSPLYAKPVVVDRTPPLLLSVTLNGVALGEGAAREVVLRDAAASARLVIAGLDGSGLARVVVQGDIQNSFVVDAGAGGQISASIDVPIPAAEGAYLVKVQAVDLAGNVTDPDAAQALVVRDLEAPRTPLPVAGQVETFGPRAFLWLEAQADCPVGAEPFACESVPPSGPLFQLRGGALLDFTAVAGPPFIVDVPADAVTRFEIRAKDAAGNVSAGTAIIDVTRTATRSRFVVPPDREVGVPVVGTPSPSVQRANLGDPSVPPLVASSGTAFFAVRPRVGAKHQTAYTVLVGQPADLPSVGLRYSTSDLPTAIRRLSYLPSDGTYRRTAGAFGGAPGLLTWMEVAEDDDVGAFPTQMTLNVDANGRFDIAGTDLTNTAKLSNGEEAKDDEGESTVNGIPIGRIFFPQNSVCTFAGPARCSTDLFGWRGTRSTAPPATAVIDDTRIAVAGLSTKFTAIEGPAAASLVLPAGTFRVVGAALTGTETFGPRASSVDMPIDVPAGTTLHAAVYTDTGNAGVLNLEGGTDDVLTFVAQGGGIERIWLPPGGLRAVGTGERFVVGVILPPEVEATIALVDQSALTRTPDEVGVPVGLVVETSATLEALATISRTGLVDSTVIPPMLMTLPSAASGGAPIFAGISIADIGRDRAPEGPALPRADFDASRDALAEEHRFFVPVEAPGVDPITTASADEPFIPTQDQRCVAVLRVAEDTPLENVTITGAGLLDDLRVSVFKSDDGRATGRFTSDDVDFPVTLSFKSGVDGLKCSELAATSRVDTVTGVPVPGIVVAFDEVAIGRVPASDSVVVDYNVPFGDLLPVQTIAVTPGALMEFRTEEDIASFGDADLVIEFDDGSLFFGSLIGNEDVTVIVPIDATSVTVSVEAFDDDVVGQLTTSVVQGLFDVADFPITGNPERIQVSAFSGTDDLDVRLLVRFDAAPTADVFDCAVDDRLFFEACDFAPPPGATRVFVAAQLVDEFVQIGDRVEAQVIGDSGFAPIEVSRQPVFPGETARVTITDSVANGPTLVIELQDDAGTVLNRCSTGNECRRVVPAGATVLVVSLEPGEATANDTKIQTEIFSAGCDRAVATRSGFNFAPQILRGGDTYAVVVDGDGPWPASNPIVQRGAPQAAGTADIELVGTLLSPRRLSFNQMVIDAFDSAETCAMTINVQRRVKVESTAVVGDVAAAVLVDDGEARVAVADLTEAVPALSDVYAAAAGDQIAALALDGADHVRFVETSGTTVRLRAEHVDPAIDEGCIAFEDAIALRGATVTDRGHTMVLFGDAVGGPTVIVYSLGDDPCAPPTLRLRQRTPTTPIAAAIDGDDLFILHTPAGSGGELLHVDLRAIELLTPAGLREVVGAVAVDADTVVVSEAPRIGGEGVLHQLNVRTGVDALIASGATAFQPQGISDASGTITAIASVDVDTSRGASPRLQLHGLAGSVVELSALLTAAPPFDPLDPRRLAREPIIASDGGQLAVLGFDGAGGRILTVLRTDGVSEQSRVTLSEGLPDRPRSLELQGGVVIVGYDIGARAFVDDGSDLVEVTVGDDERIMALAGSDLLVGVSPGDLFALQAPTTMQLLRRDPRGVTDDVDLGETLPAAAFDHVFTRTVSVDDAIVMLDADASPPVTWRLRPGLPAVPADGALRPLASASVALGRSALGAGLFIRETPTGTALFRSAD